MNCRVLTSVPRFFFLHHRPSSSSLLLCRLYSASSSSGSSRSLVALSSLSKEQLGHSILFTKENMPPGSPKTPHELVATGVWGAKVLSLSSSLAGAAMVPILSSYLWEAASERPSMMAFAIVSNTFLALLSLTPLLLHFLTKRFPVNVYYNPIDKVFTTVHYNFLIQKRARRFTAADVKDAAIAPEMKKIWIPLATAFVHGHPLLISLDRNSYSDKEAFDLLTQNITIPLDHD